MHNPKTAHLGLTLVIFICMTKSTKETSVSVNKGDFTVLKCPDKKGQSLIVLTWKIQTVDKLTCIISYSPDEDPFNNCSHTINVDPELGSLHINNSQLSDEGLYTCDIATGYDTLSTSTTLQVLVPPSITLKLNSNGSLDCQAHDGNPAANIFWSPATHNAETRKENQSNRMWTTISTYNVKNASETNVTCVVSHPAFAQNRSISMSKTGETFSVWVVVSVMIIVFVVIISGFFILKHRSNIRDCIRKDKQNTDSIQECSTNAQDAEEVEPYASYTHKVNTIYNSRPDISKSDKIYWTTATGS
ncbi:cell surface glycoprotein CD200 receptor 1-A-like [Spea bombifrons]|uniref:cell surface glycoprotein CD200 receptor 1-A-like n=1 Tax=Spea bombifrons TaxID=233779 RepID=UPI00234B5C40|nr:cell surface glycoprotein CD200 receptor 1-A-like [Spea bombifrons]